MLKLPHYTRDAEFRSHLRLVHGVYVGDVKTWDGLVECHDTQHEFPDSHFNVTHTHEAPQATDDLDEWSW